MQSAPKSDPCDGYYVSLSTIAAAAASKIAPPPMRKQVVVKLDDRDAW
jgi:hypothetical protein